MTNPKTIVVAARDEQSGRTGLQRALHLLHSPNDRIHLVHVSRYESWLRVAELLTPQRVVFTAEGEQDPDHYAWLQRLSESSNPIGISVDFTVLDGKPGSSIVAFAAQKHADLVVMANPSEGQMRELFLGSNVLYVLREAICPVLIVRNNSDTSYQSALLAVDLNTAGYHVINAAKKWLNGAVFNLVHAYRVPQEGQMRIRGITSEQEVLKLRDHMKIDHEDKLEDYQKLLPAANIHLEHGWAASVILDFVFKLRPDILVLSKHRGSNRDERIFGSVTSFLLYHCPTDILLVP